MSDYYQTLGIPRDADQEQIKKAYRKLAMQHHPDRPGGDDTEFKKIQEAYATLSDDSAKQQYDFNPSGGSPDSPFSFGGVPPGFEHLFQQFGGMFNNPRAVQRNRNINLQIEVSLTDIFNGKEFIANVHLPTGQEQLVNIKIPPGMHEGNSLRLAGIGDDHFKNVPRGDIILAVKINNDTQFIRRGDDLIKESDISMWDAALGCVLSVVTIDKKTFEVKITAGTNDGQIFGIANAGMPLFNHPTSRGRLLLKINVKMPSFLTEEQRTHLEKSRPI
jgi:curved DNA-binding protein